MCVLLIYFEFYIFDVYNVCVVNFVISEFRATTNEVPLACNSCFVVFKIRLNTGKCF